MHSASQSVLEHKSNSWAWEVVPKIRDSVAKVINWYISCLFNAWRRVKPSRFVWLGAVSTERGARCATRKEYKDPAKIFLFGSRWSPQFNSKTKTDGLTIKHDVVKFFSNFGCWCQNYSFVWKRHQGSFWNVTRKSNQWKHFTVLYYVETMMPRLTSHANSAE